jgi:hypothetical protein
MLRRVVEHRWLFAVRAARALGHLERNDLATL